MVSNNNGYSGDFELALIPESFLTDVMHEVEDANGVIAENKDVGLSILRCSLSSPATRGRSVTACTTAARPVPLSPAAQGGLHRGADGNALHYGNASAFRSVKVKTGTNTSEETYNNWYNAVYQPQAAVNVPETPAEDVTE